MSEIRLMKIQITFILFAFFLVSNAQKKSNLSPINTDRPDQTESPQLMPKGFFQVETGFVYSETENKVFQEKNTSFNATLLRYGLLENLELRLEFELSETKKSFKNGMSTITRSGMKPMFTGIKIGIIKEKGWIPEIGFLGGIQLTFVATEAYKTPGTGGDILLAFSHTLNEKWGFSYNIGSVWNGENPYVSYVYSGVLDYAFSQKLTGFVEVYGDFPEHSESGHSFDGGITYLLTENIQLDLAGGTGLTSEKEFFIGVGISARFPH